MFDVLDFSFDSGSRISSGALLADSSSARKVCPGSCSSAGLPRRLALLAAAGVIAVAALPGSMLAQGLSPQSAKLMNAAGEPINGVLPGEEFLFQVPVTNVTSSTQSNSLGVAVPITAGANILNPVSNYGNVAVATTADGSAFRGSVDADSGAKRNYTFKVGLKSDQGQQDHTINVKGSTGFGDGSKLAAWPVHDYPDITLSAAAGAAANELYVNSTAGLIGGTLYKNQRTNELIHVRAVEPTGNKVLVKRGQFGGVNPAPCENGDSLVFEGVPIPDATGTGVAFKVPVNSIAGPIGNVRLLVESIVHPRVGDLMVTLEDGVSTPVMCLAPLEGGLASGADITDVMFDDAATTTAKAQRGRLAAGSYVPDEPLSTFADTEGSSVTAWTLRVSDIAAPSVGYVKSWSLEPGE